MALFGFPPPPPFFPPFGGFFGGGGFGFGQANRRQNFDDYSDAELEDILLRRERRRQRMYGQQNGFGGTQVIGQDQGQGPGIIPYGTIQTLPINRPAAGPYVEGPFRSPDWNDPLYGGDFGPLSRLDDKNNNAYDDDYDNNKHHSILKGKIIKYKKDSINDRNKPLIRGNVITKDKKPYPPAIVQSDRQNRQSGKAIPGKIIVK